MNTDSDKIAVLLKKASLEAERIQSPILQGRDLTVSQYKILIHLYQAPVNSVRLVDLEAFCSMTHPAVIDVLKGLEKRGYCQRVANPDDARSKIVALTDKARSQRDELMALGEEMELAVTANLDEVERTQLATLLKKILERQTNR